MRVRARGDDYSHFILLGVGCDNDTQITHPKLEESKLLHHPISSTFTYGSSGIFRFSTIEC